MSDSKEVYTTPEVIEGKVVEIYACGQSTCNGKSRSIRAEYSEQDLEDRVDIIKLDEVI